MNIKFNTVHLQHALTCLALIIFLSVSVAVGDIYLFTDGFTTKFHPCLDLVNSLRLSHGLYFIPLALGLLAFGVSIPRTIAWLAVLSVLFYGFLASFWTRAGCLFDYELIHWAGTVGTIAAMFAHAPDKLKTSTTARPAIFSASILASTLVAWLSGASTLDMANYGFFTMTAGVWQWSNSQLVSAVTVLAMSMAPSAIISVKLRRLTFLSRSAATGSIVYAALLVLPHAFNIPARIIEPISSLGLVFPLIVALSLRQGGLTRS